MHQEIENLLLTPANFEGQGIVTVSEIPRLTWRNEIFKLILYYTV